MVLTFIFPLCLGSPCLKNDRHSPCLVMSLKNCKGIQVAVNKIASFGYQNLVCYGIAAPKQKVVGWGYVARGVFPQQSPATL